MPIKTIIKPSEYHDSVSLMLVAQELAKSPGVSDAAVVMATEANKGILEEAGLLTAEAQAASPNDLVIAVSGEDRRAERRPGSGGEAAANPAKRRRERRVPSEDPAQRGQVQPWRQRRRDLGGRALCGG